MAQLHSSWRTWHFGIVGEDSEFCGEEFLVALQNATKKDAIAYAHEQFPNEKLRCYGEVSEFEADIMGLDTY